MTPCPVLEAADAQVFITASMLEVTPAPTGSVAHESPYCPDGGEAMSPCLLLLRGATGTHCLSQPLCQRSLALGAASSWATVSFPSQLVGLAKTFYLARKTQRSLNLYGSPTYQVLCVPLAQNESNERETDKRHKTAELPLLQRKRLTLAFLPPREGDNGFSGKAMLYQL